MKTILFACNFRFPSRGLTNPRHHNSNCVLLGTRLYVPLQKANGLVVMSRLQSDPAPKPLLRMGQEGGLRVIRFLSACGNSIRLLRKRDKMMSPIQIRGF